MGDGLGAMSGTSAGSGAPVIYVIDSVTHPLPLAEAAAGIASSVVRVPVGSWGDDLTPWPAPALRPGEKDFGGRADETLAGLVGEVGLRDGSCAVCGYSLGGLFALYAFAREPRLTACACLSGSVWYEGWIDWLRANAPDCSGRYAFFSVGKKERRAGLPFRHVEEDLAACASILRERGCEVDVALGPGSHMQHVAERLAAGLAALDAALRRGPSAPSPCVSQRDDDEEQNDDKEHGEVQVHGAPPRARGSRRP